MGGGEGWDCGEEGEGWVEGVEVELYVVGFSSGW